MRTILLATMLASALLPKPAFSQYSDADKIISSCRHCIIEASERVEANPKIVESIVYPEVMRYSALRDCIERSIVNGMYVKYGLSQGDFSIGIFQMKPSFVEQLERRWNTADSLPYSCSLFFSTMSRSQYSRSQRIGLMSTIEGQCMYAAVFVRLMYYCFRDLTMLSSENQVRIIATAYNHGVDWRATSLDEIERWSACNTFHTDIAANPLTQYSNYGSLAAEHFRSICD